MSIPESEGDRGRSVGEIRDGFELVNADPVARIETWRRPARVGGYIIQRWLPFTNINLETGERSIVGGFQLWHAQAADDESRRGGPRHRVRGDRQIFPRPRPRDPWAFFPTWEDAVRAALEHEPHARVRR